MDHKRRRERSQNTPTVAFLLDNVSRKAWLVHTLDTPGIHGRIGIIWWNIANSAKGLKRALN